MYNSADEVLLITNKLKPWGIEVDATTGAISYFDTQSFKLRCSHLFLIRHGKTVATCRGELMSDYSANSKLTNESILELKDLAARLSWYNFDVALSSYIPRVFETKNIIMSVPQSFDCICLDFLKGINNSGWEYKKLNDLINDNVFIEREVNHNIFAKTDNGNSWGDVLLNCISTIDYINDNFENKKVLLISQGSILRGLKIMLKRYGHPWQNYSAINMFHLTTINHISNYGKLESIYP